MGRIMCQKAFAIMFTNQSNRTNLPTFLLFYIFGIFVFIIFSLLLNPGTYADFLRLSTVRLKSDILVKYAGSQVVNLLTRQLNGEMTEITETGTSTRFRFNLTKAA